MIPRVKHIPFPEKMATVPSDEELKSVSLYGGAFACKLPSAFQDVRYNIIIVSQLSFTLSL